MYKNIKNGIIQNVKPTTKTWLIEAAFMGNIAFIQLYIEYNGDLNILDNNGKNALHLACMCNNVEVSKILIYNKIMINHKESNKHQAPIHYCIIYRSYDCMKVLIENNCDINIQE